MSEYRPAYVQKLKIHRSTTETFLHGKGVSVKKSEDCHTVTARGLQSARQCECPLRSPFRGDAEVQEES